MKKILYITHVPWGFIKQRPQFLAEGLTEYYQVDVLYRKTNRKSQAATNNNHTEVKNFSVKGFRNLPFERIKFLPLNTFQWINKWLFRKEISYLDSYDLVWLTSPDFLPLVEDKVPMEKIVYDCMDDNLEFPYILRYPKKREEIKRLEAKIFAECKIALFSAKNLIRICGERAEMKCKPCLVNNAITENITIYSEESNYKLEENTFTYIGTVSEWFDYDLLTAALDKHSDIHFSIFGPYSEARKFEYPRVKYWGSVKHSEILGIMKQSKALIMPFKMNDLIASVNPVKLYEYIYAGKPVIALRYSETEQFSQFVQLYSDKEEFVSIVDKIMADEIKTTPDEMVAFTKQNTWRNRVENIKQILEDNNLL